MNSFHSILAVFLFAVILTATTQAQDKIRYVNANRVLQEYAPYQEAEREISELERQFAEEYNDLRDRLLALEDELKSQALLLSPEKKAEKERQRDVLSEEMTRYQYEKFGQPNGEIYKKIAELRQPIFDKIQEVIQKVGNDQEYDFILDNSQSTVLFVKEDYDITDEIIDELNKTQ